MKKILIIIGIIVVLLVATLAAIPLFFKQTLIEKAKTTINKNVNAEVKFADLKLSLLRSFPKVTLELTDVLVVGKGEFQKDTIFTVPSLRTKTALRQLFNKDNIGIEEIILDRPVLKLVVGPTGNVNWDLMLESEEVAGPVPSVAGDTEEDGLVLQLEKIEIIKANFIYEDREMDMLLKLDDIDTDISGKMYGTSAQLLAEGTVAKFLLNYAGVNYISNTSVETRTVLNVDYDKMDIEIQENELLVNRLPLEVLGLIQMPNDSMFFDLQIQTKESGFDNFLALVPPDYEEYLKDIQTNGTATISGTVKGFYFEEDYPAFDLKLDVADGNLHYTGMPEEIKNISADVSVSKPQGLLDLTEVNIKKMHAEVKDNPLALSLFIKDLVSKPYMEGNFSGRINFHDVKNAIPLDTLTISGYTLNMKDLQINGTANVSGSVKGVYSEEDYPAFDLKMDLANGNLKYAGLIDDINNISADVSVAKPQGIIDLAGINIKKVHAEVNNSPVDLSLFLKNLDSDPWFDGNIIGKIDLDDLKNALHLDSVYVSGVLDMNLKVKGSYSAIENEQYDRIQSDGIVKLTRFVYESPSLTQRVIVPEGQLTFTPQAVSLSGMNVNIGQSDFRLSGRVTNYLNYVLKDGTLAGNLQLNSSLVNLNELLRLQIVKESPEGQEQTAVVAPSAEEEEEVLVFDVPKNLDFTFQSNIQQVIFERLPITDVNGLITARDGKLVLDGLNMQLLGGELKLTGSYENTEENKPFFDFDFNLADIDIPEAYKTLPGVQRMIPIARQSQGKFNSSLKVNGQLSPGFGLLATTIDGSGLFSTENLQIIESPMFGQLKGILKSERLNNVSVEDFRAFVEVENGTILLKPFTTRIAGQETTIAGNLNTENLIDMRLDFNVQRDAFGNDIQNILSVLPGQERIQLIPASVVLSGPVGKPEMRIDLEEARKMITEEVKKSTRDNLQENLNKIGEGLRNLLK